jgi:hypothetical protein
VSYPARKYLNGNSGVGRAENCLSSVIYVHVDVYVADLRDRSVTWLVGRCIERQTASPQITILSNGDDSETLEVFCSPDQGADSARC